MKEDKDNKEPPYGRQFVCLAPEVGELIYDYLIGELKADTVSNVEEHIIFCLRCQADLGTLRTVVASWKRDPQVYFPNRGHNKKGQVRESQRQV